VNQLVAGDLAEYRDSALRLAGDKMLRESLRAQLTAEHLLATLFNTRDYVLRIEDLFQQMIDLQRRGLPPSMLRCRARTGNDSF
jgi:predicted O-linked N-acetylglucosamine transferase (SPINDLY family)